MTHRFHLRVYYEDTDLAGLVYHANYLKFIERARSEWVREMGIDQAAMKAADGTVFVVTRIEADYRAPARYDDLLTVETTIARATRVRAVFEQTVLRGPDPLFSALVTVTCVDGAGRPKRLPPVLAEAATAAGNR